LPGVQRHASYGERIKVTTSGALRNLQLIGNFGRSDTPAGLQQQQDAE
jgi:hypothetical protein